MGQDTSAGAAKLCLPQSRQRIDGFGRVKGSLRWASPTLDTSKSATTNPFKFQKNPETDTSKLRNDIACISHVSIVYIFHSSYIVDLWLKFRDRRGEGFSGYRKA